MAKRQAKEAKIAEISQTLAEESAKVGKELEAVRAESDAVAKQLEELKTSQVSRAIEKKAFLEQTAPIEAKLASLNREMDARQQLIDFLR